MNIIWEGTDITDYVTVRKAAAHDTCGGRCDSLEIEFENAESWYRWGPKEDNRIQIYHEGWDSGILYLNTIAPTGGKYRVLATALPCKARKKQWDSFENRTIEEILRRCAAQTEMDFACYGIEKECRIPYIQRENESCAAFLHRTATLEGAKLKCVNGRYTLIGLDWAQDQNPVENVRIAADQDGIDYKRSGVTEKSLTIITPYATGVAVDDEVDNTHTQAEIVNLPATENIQAARWARNLLKNRNRKCESLTIRSKFNPAWSAMCRVDVSGGTDADGEWIIEEVEHDLKDGTSRATLHRCIRSVR